ncbi:MAG: DUF1295 domain-containing protein [Actinomycetota bacterium]
MAGWVVLVTAAPMREMVIANGIAQVLLFVPVVLVPAWRTGRISYVDIGWPLGLAVIGVVVLVLGDGDRGRVVAVGVAYLLMGVRMGAAALVLWRKGHLAAELPRYAYQRRRWERANVINTRLMGVVEASAQGLANTSVLAIPALVIAVNPDPGFSPFEWTGLVVWLLAFAMESVADRQKMAFNRDARRRGDTDAVCRVGLWRYSRHPNYFAEWMVWTGLVIAAIPSWWSLRDHVGVVSWILLGVGLALVSRVMFVTLVHYTGAKPAEYYSVQKRPDYADYQRTTNIFFPGPLRVADGDRD